MLSILNIEESYIIASVQSIMDATEANEDKHNKFMQRLEADNITYLPVAGFYVHRSTGFVSREQSIVFPQSWWEDLCGEGWFTNQESVLVLSPRYDGYQKAMIFWLDDLTPPTYIGNFKATSEREAIKNCAYTKYKDTYYICCL